MYSNEELIEYIKKLKPDYEQSDNCIFFKDDAKNLFTLEELANIIISVKEDLLWHLYMNIFEYGNKDDKDINMQIAKKNPSFFNKLTETEYMLFDMGTLITEYEKCYDKDIIIRADDSEYLSSKKFLDYVITVKKLYKEHRLDSEECKHFYSILSKKLIEKSNSYYDEDIILEVCGYILSGDIMLRTIANDVGFSIEKCFAIGKFNLQDASGLNVDTLKGIKKSYVYNLINILKNNNIELNDEQKRGLIKLIAILGYSNAEKVIKYNHNTLDVLNNFSIIDLTNYNNIIKETFINLFMGKNINEPTSLLNTIYESVDEIRINMNYVFNYWENIELRFKNQKLDSKTEFIRRLLETSRCILSPSEYKLEGKIIETCLDDRQYVHTSTPNLIYNVRKIYSDMKHKYYKSIPYVSGTYEEYTYETLKSNDPKLFELGSDTNCCFKVCGDANNFVEYCANSPQGRVAVITNKNDKICAMIPMVRNGNLILANSIESEAFRDQDHMKKMFEIFRLISNEMLRISEEKESNEEHIMAVLIGNYKNQIDKYIGLERESSLTFSTVSPLKDDLYFNGGGYDWENYFVSKRDDYNPSNVHKFESQTIYLDPRKETLELEYDEINDEVIKIINAISYEYDESLIDTSNIQRLSFNDDWFIILTKDLNVIHKKVGNDPRALVEYEEMVNLFLEYSNESKTENYKFI